MVRGRMAGSHARPVALDLSGIRSAVACAYASDMSHAAMALRSAWESSLAEIGIVADSVLIGGPLADRVGDAVPIAIADEVASLVVLGAGPMLPDDATVEATGLPDASVASVVMLDAWDDAAGLADVVTEARRIVAPGGTVWLGRRNVDAMVQSTPSIMRAALLYARHPDQIRGLLGSESVAETEMALLRGRISAIESWDHRLPVDAFGDAAAYRAAVLDGMWFGIDRISDAERAAVLAALDDSLDDAEFPVVEYQPWTLAHGYRA